MDRGLYLVRADGSLLEISDFFKSPVIAPGLDGERGERGLTGPAGPPGASVPGEKGDRGPQGATGAQGNTGPQGLTGRKGDKGDKGDTGPQGQPGKSIVGPQGPPGSVTYIGPEEIAAAVQACRAELIRERARVRAAVIVAIEGAENIQHAARALVLAHLRNLQQQIGE